MINRPYGAPENRLPKPLCHRILLGLLLFPVSVGAPTSAGAQPSVDEVESALQRAVSFFRQHAAAGGGYVYQLSADLKKREGEGKVGATTAWIQPPGTPAVGLAYLRAYQACGDQVLLDATRETAAALVRGQLRSGGWDNRIEFNPSDRKNYAYRVEPDGGRSKRNTTTFDDDKSQSAIRFLMKLDQQLSFQDPTIHESTLYALDGVLKSQYACGAWPQRYDPNSESHEILDSAKRRAAIPPEWSRSFPGTKYSAFYTLNDNTISDIIASLLDAWEIYDDDRYRAAAERGGEFLIRAQLPEPQPGWAQQYDRNMHPAWARKFEPPAITGGESQGVMQTLMLLYQRTAAASENPDRFLEPIPRALAYYRRSTLEDGRLARFYELGTNRPLYFTKDYQLTYSSDDMPTHYAFIVSSRLDRIERQWNRLRQLPRDQLGTPSMSRWSRNKPSDQRIDEIIQGLDERGAWVETGRLRYHGDADPTREVIRSQTFIDNLLSLAVWLGG